MLSTAVSRWLSEYKSLKDAQLSSYAHSIRNDQELIEDLYRLFENVTVLCSEVVDPVCHQLFDFYRSLNVELQRFTLELVPSLIWTYLQALANNDKSKCGGIEACLLGIYNLEVVDKDGKAKVREVTIPTLACVSLYHEPPSLASQVLTESALMRYHSDKPIVIEVGRLPQVENINAQNRLPVLSYIINRYNADITNLSQKSHQFLCQICSRIAKSGFGELDEMIDVAGAGALNGISTSAPKRGVSFVESNRIPLSSGLLVELLTAVYYAMYNGQARDARRALDDIHFRASYELYSEVILVTNAIRNSLDMTSAAQPMDGPMGISIALSPAQGNPAFNKDAITNASFRAKRLPEDIEVLDESKKPASEVPPVIIEESAEGDAHSLSTRTSTGDTERLKSSPGVKVPKAQQLKSIMKKRDKDKVSRKDSADISANSLPQTTTGAGGKRGSHLKDHHLLSDLQQQRSPKHSASSTGIAGGGMSVVNGSDVADVGAIHMHIIRSSSNRAVSAEQVDIVGGMGTSRVSETALFSGGSATTDNTGVTLAVRSSTSSAGAPNNHSKRAIFLNGADVMSDGGYDDSFENDGGDNEEGVDATKL